MACKVRKRETCPTGLGKGLVGSAVRLGINAL